MTKVINSPAAEVPRTAKKAEGKKEKVPLHPPIEKKGRGKKTERNKTMKLTKTQIKEKQEADSRTRGGGRVAQ